MPYCNICMSLTIDVLDDNDVPFHANLGALKLSAEQGCKLCRLFWTRILEDWSPKTVSSCLRGDNPNGTGGHWEASIWLRGEFSRGSTLMGRTGSETGASIWVSCGKMPSVHGEPGSNGGLGLGLEARLAVFALDTTSITSTLLYPSLTRLANQRTGYTGSVAFQGATDHGRLVSRTLRCPSLRMAQKMPRFTQALRGCSGG